MTRKAFSELPRYRSFTNDRDKAAEQLLRNAQADVSRALNEALTRSLEIVARGYALIPTQHFFTSQATHTIKLIENRLEHVFLDLGTQIADRWLKLRRHAFMLASLSESEAIAQSLGKNLQNRLSSSDLNARAFSKTQQNETLISRTALALNRLKRSILDAVELARVREETLTDALKRVEGVFPRAMIYSRPPRVLKPIREADQVGPKLLSDSFIDEEEWEDFLEHYKNTQLPKTRFYNEPLDLDMGGGDYEEWYSWEIEKELTHDFVAQVRAGQNDAANKAGIKDFVWIAIIDDKTDDCCLWRDGMTTKEIEEALKNKHKGDECDDIAPPIHMNCRCTLAPVGDVPERPEVNLGSFADWILED